jgi:hypothetical protein
VKGSFSVKTVELFLSAYPTLDLLRVEGQRLLVFEKEKGWRGFPVDARQNEKLPKIVAYGRNVHEYSRFCLKHS